MPSQRSKQKKPGRKHNYEPRIINRRATHDYFISDKLECGVQLHGSEVKAVRLGLVSLAEGYVAVENDGRLLLRNVDIGLYPHAGPFAHDPRRPRVLLAHKREINKLRGAATAKGTTIIPLQMYFVRGRIKCEIGLGTGKKQYDKRQDLKKKEADRDMRRALSKHLH